MNRLRLLISLCFAATSFCYGKKNESYEAPYDFSRDGGHTFEGKRIYVNKIPGGYLAYIAYHPKDCSCRLCEKGETKPCEIQDVININPARRFSREENLDQLTRESILWFLALEKVLQSGCSTIFREDVRFGTEYGGLLKGRRTR